MMNRQCGFSLITAIFLLVVLAGLMTYMIRLSSIQHTTVVMGVQGARALQAARSAMDFAIDRALNSGGCGSVTTASPITFTQPALQSFSVTLSCTSSSHTEAAIPFDVFTLTAEATAGNYLSAGVANPDYVSRRIRATVSNTPP